METASALTNDKLVARLGRMAKQGARLDVSLIEHLAEFLSRDLHVELGLSSAHAYAVKRLGFAPSVAARRIRAAKSVAANPMALSYLQLGQLSISSLAALAPAINSPGILEFAKGRPCREIEAHVAALFGKDKQDDLPTSVRLSRRLRRRIAVAARCLNQDTDASAIEVIEQAIEELIATRPEVMRTREPVSERVVEPPPTNSKPTRRKPRFRTLLVQQALAWARLEPFWRRSSANREEPQPGAATHEDRAISPAPPSATPVKQPMPAPQRSTNRCCFIEIALGHRQQV